MVCGGMTERLFDPIAYVRSHGGTVRLDEAGRVAVAFDRTSPARQAECRRLVAKYERLIRLQLDVPPGERPRSVQQLVALGLVRVVGRRFRLVGRISG